MISNKSEATFSRAGSFREPGPFESQALSRARSFREPGPFESQALSRARSFREPGPFESQALSACRAKSDGGATNRCFYIAIVCFSRHFSDVHTFSSFLLYRINFCYFYCNYAILSVIFPLTRQPISLLLWQNLSFTKLSPYLIKHTCR